MKRVMELFPFRRPSMETLENRQLLAADLPMITEFMAANQRTIDDGNGDSSDWIEIFNPTDDEVDLAGWTLTDNPTLAEKWTFPDHPSSRIASQQYIVVFASGNDQVDRQSNLHTNFKLSANGEYLALVDPSSVVVSEFGADGTEYPEQLTDISYGIEGVSLVRPLIQYVDATAGVDGNTRLSEATNGTLVFEPAGIDIPNQGNDGAWEQRTFGNGDSIFETGIDTTSDNGPALTTSVAGLDAGSYEVFAYFWSDTNNNWDLQAGINSDAMQIFQPGANGVKALAGNGLLSEGFEEPILVSEGNRTLFQISLGEQSISTGQSIEVFVDDVPNAAGRSWYDGIGVRRSESLIDSRSDAELLIPSNNDLGTSWTANDFDATANGFSASLAAIGYENNPNADDSYAADIATFIPRRTTSAYLRIPFFVADASSISALELDLKFDDGFIAYLNGQRILEEFAPANPSHRSTATAGRSDSTVRIGSTYSLSAFRHLLVDGQNTLAFHALNQSNTSSDMLLSPKLIASTGVSSGEVRYMSDPTPGAPNAAGFRGFVQDTSFSVDRGFFDEPFDVRIVSETVDAQIFYTTDGSEPAPGNTNAALYTAPVRIERTTNLRAAAFKDGFRPTNIDTQTYLFLSDVLKQDPRNDPDDDRVYPASWQGNVAGDYEMDARVVQQWSDENPLNNDVTILDGLMSIPTMSLTLDHDDLWDRSSGIYPNASERDDEWRRAGSVEFIDPNSNAEFQYDVGIQMHGAASSFNERLLKHSFRLRFSPEFGGPSKLEFPLFDNSDFADINQIVLRAAFTDAFGTRTVTNRYSPLDSTYMRDVWMRDAQLATGGTAAQSTYVHLYINGLYWGLYNPAERSTDEQFFVSHFGGQQEDWDILKDFNELASGNRDAWNAMFAIARSMTSANADAKFQEIQGKNNAGEDEPSRTNYLNMDRFIDYIALHLYAGVEDWPSHNWHAGFNRENPGKGFEFLTWDQEIGLDQLARDRTEVSNANTPGELFSRLSRSEEFRLRVADRVQALFFYDGALTVENNQQRWMERAKQIEQAIIGESARWGDAREGQVVTAYSTSGPLEDGEGKIPTGRQRVPLMTVDHWRDSVAYVSDTFFSGALDVFLQRLGRDDMFLEVVAPKIEFDSFTQTLVLTGSASNPDDSSVYYTLDGTDPRLPGGLPRGTLYQQVVALGGPSVTVNARTLEDGEWSPLAIRTWTLTDSFELGDVNANGGINSDDIDTLFAFIMSEQADDRSDLNADGEVTNADADFLIETILGTRRGDFDLNGRVEFADFLILSTNFTSQSVSWSDGDTNGDGKVDFADFLLLSSNFGFSRIPR